MRSKLKMLSMASLMVVSFAMSLPTGAAQLTPTEAKNITMFKTDLHVACSGGAGKDTAEYAKACLSTLKKYSAPEFAGPAYKDMRTQLWQKADEILEKYGYDAVDHPEWVESLAVEFQDSLVSTMAQIIQHYHAKGKVARDISPEKRAIADKIWANLTEANRQKINAAIAERNRAEAAERAKALPPAAAGIGGQVVQAVKAFASGAAAFGRLLFGGGK